MKTFFEHSFSILIFFAKKTKNGRVYWFQYHFQSVIYYCLLIPRRRNIKKLYFFYCRFCCFYHFLRVKIFDLFLKKFYLLKDSTLKMNEHMLITKSFYLFSLIVKKKKIYSKVTFFIFSNKKNICRWNQQTSYIFKDFFNIKIMKKISKFYFKNTVYNFFRND